MVIAAGSSTIRRKLAISPQCRRWNRAVATWVVGAADTAIAPGRGAAGAGCGAGWAGTACSAAAAWAARSRRRAIGPGTGAGADGSDGTALRTGDAGCGSEGDWVKGAGRLRVRVQVASCGSVE